MKLSFHSYLSMLAFGVAMATDDNISCDLNCPRNAPCRFGLADFSQRNGALTDGMESHRNDMHCDCPIGWTGIMCDKKYETCTNQNGHECYNGGECILGLQDKYGNEQLFCDCSNSIGYVGKYCETPFKQKCDSGDTSDIDVFCVNGNECNPDFPESSSQPCFCDEGWEGFNCEYKKNSVPECSLACQNEGVCFVGTTAKGQDMAQNHPWSLQEREDRMFCNCLPGFGGRLCEAQAEQCGSSDGHVCLNGGKCVTNSVETPNGSVRSQHHCDCATAKNERNDHFAGKYCEHKATSMCSNDDWTLFCTQGGTCQSNPMEGCLCPEGTSGYQCEFVSDDYAKITGAYNENDDNQNKEEDYIQEDGYRDDYIQEGFPYNNNKNMDECADGFCLNGGYCVVDQIFQQDGSYRMQEYCDCSQAYDVDSNYAGRYCQYKSTSLCVVENTWQESVDEAFCVHNGICQDDGSCDCPSGWTGQFCELKFLEINQNSVNKHNTNMHTGTGSTNLDFEKCGETFCYNGGTCVQDEFLQSSGSLVIDTHCDCSTAFDERHLYAGMSCEFPSTKICWIPEGSDGLEGSTFCTNHGSCNNDAKLGCECLPGFSGFACEYESHNHKNEFDDRAADKVIQEEFCGYRNCQNGGTCITSTTYSDETKTIETRYMCDCSTAFDDDTAYLGPSCEYSSTIFCESPKSGEPLSSARFCVNHGTCQQDPSKGCDCDFGFTGRSCQIKTEFDENDSKYTFDIDDGQDMELCGDDLICINGGRCVTSVATAKNGETVEVRKCNCDLTSSGKDSCQYAITDTCTIGDKYPGQPLYFCVNGGSCNGWVLEDDPDTGCTCPNSFSGPHCEVYIAIGKHRVSGSKVNNAGVIAACLLLLLGVIALFIIFYLRLRIRMAAKNRSNTGAKKSILLTGNPFSLQRRRVVGFDGLPSQKRSVSAIEMASSTDTDQIVFEHIDDSDGVASDHFEDERSASENPVFVVNASLVNERKLQCPHFV